MHDYQDRDYGDAIADVYDAWYGDITDLDAQTPAQWSPLSR